MRIAFVSQPFGDIVPGAVSGAIQMWTCEIARRLARRCHVVVCTKRGRWAGSLRLHKKLEWDQGVLYRRWSVLPDTALLGIRTLFSGSGTIEGPWFAAESYYSLYIRAVAKYLARTGCDIVHVINFSQWVPVVRRFCPGAKIVLHMRCEWLTQLDRLTIGQRLEQADAIIGCSEFVTEKIRRRFPEHASRCRAVLNGVDITRFRPRDSGRARKPGAAPRLLFVGRVSPEKGVHVLLDAFQQVVTQYPEAQLEIVGPLGSPPIDFIVKLAEDQKVRNLASFYNGEYYSHLQERVAWCTPGRVVFSGRVFHPAVHEHYRDADIFVFPSVWDEPFGVPVIEAMASEVPVIATRVGGIPEMIEDGKNGLLVEADNAEALAGAILRLLENEDLRRSLGKAGRQRAVEQFSFDMIAERLLSEYGNLCGSGRTEGSE